MRNKTRRGIRAKGTAVVGPGELQPAEERGAEACAGAARGSRPTAHRSSLMAHGSRLTAHGSWLIAHGLRLLPPLALLALGLAAWQALTVEEKVPDYLLPGPLAIWQTTQREWGLLAQNAVPTIEIAVFGFLLALALGVLLAVGIHHSQLLRLALYPIVITSQTIPVIALAPILVILLGFGIMPKLIIVCLICFFPIVVNTVDGFESVDPDLINLMRTLGAGRLRLLREVEFPSALPYLFSGAKVAATYSVIGAIFGEWAGSFQGLGYLLTQKSNQFDTAGAFSAILLLTLLGIGMFAVISLAERLMLPWYHGERKRNALAGRPRA